MLPDWMTEPSAGQPAALSVKGSTAGARFIDRSLRELRKAVQYQLQTEQYARQPGFLQQIDPGIKLLAVLLFILMASLNHSFPALASMWLISLLILKVSRLPVLYIQIVIWGSIPLLTLLVSLPAALNVFVSGEQLWEIYDSGQPVINIWQWTLPGKIYFSQEGVLAAVRLSVRTGLSITAAFMLTLTTPASRLFRSLSMLKIPPYFVMIVEMCYRYIAVLINISIEIFEARKVRTIGQLASRQSQALFGSSLAALFIRSLRLSEEIYESMTARGYTGEIQIALKDALQRRDVIFLVSTVLLMILLYAGGTSFDRGSIFF